ncbi:MAG: phosphodiesterase [Granulosicoccus sp.]
MKFIHMTDTHLLRDGEWFLGFDTQSRFERCVQSIREKHSDAHCIIVTGDIAERGEPEAYRHFHEQMATVGVPVYSIPGNHDLRHNYSSVFPKVWSDPSGFAQQAIRTPAGIFLLLDTLLDNSDAGTLCEHRLQWLSDQLIEFSSEPVFLFMHHPPFDLHMPAIDSIGLINKEPFKTVIKSHLNIRHLFFGHAHRPVSGHWHGISFSSMSGTNHRAPLDLKGVGNMEVVDNPEYAIVIINGDQLVVHTQSFLDDYC